MFTLLLHFLCCSHKLPPRETLVAPWWWRRSSAALLPPPVQAGWFRRGQWAGCGRAPGCCRQPPYLLINLPSICFWDYVVAVISFEAICWILHLSPGRQHVTHFQNSSLHTKVSFICVYIWYLLLLSTSVEDFCLFYIITPSCGQLSTQFWLIGHDIMGRLSVLLLHH